MWSDIVRIFRPRKCALQLALALLQSLDKYLKSQTRFCLHSLRVSRIQLVKYGHFVKH